MLTTLLTPVCLFREMEPPKDELNFLNVGTGTDLSIRDLSCAIARATGYEGDIFWDSSKPDGTPKKLLDVSRLSALGWVAQISLADGLSSTVDTFRHDLDRKTIWN